MSNMQPSWENCLICGKGTLPDRRVLRALGRKFGAIHQGRCYMEYLRIKGEVRRRPARAPSPALEWEERN
jgi:hypothetical protein